MEAIVVLGMHRSGTSLIAEMVKQWGAFIGLDEELIPAAPSNARGHWELAALVDFNDRLLARCNASSWCPPSDESTATLRKLARDSQYRAGAHSLIAKMQTQDKPWVWKDPRLCVLLPFWKEIWSNARYIIAVRHPIEVAISLRKRDGFSISSGLLLWQRYLSQLVQHTGDTTNRLVIDYRTSIEQPLLEAARLRDFLDGQFGNIGQAVTTIAEAVVQSECHNCITDLVEPVTITSPQEQMYRLLAKWANGRQVIDEIASIKMPQNWREHLRQPSKEWPQALNW